MAVQRQHNLFAESGFAGFGNALIYRYLTHCPQPARPPTQKSINRSLQVRYSILLAVIAVGRQRRLIRFPSWREDGEAPLCHLPAGSRNESARPADSNLQLTRFNLYILLSVFLNFITQWIEKKGNPQKTNT
jgi:hypothetical protein